MYLFLITCYYDVHILSLPTLSGEKIVVGLSVLHMFDYTKLERH